MPYASNINTTTPGCLLILIDQSASMSEPWAAGAGSKADNVARIVNDTLRTFALMCRDGSEWKHRFDVGIIGYGDDNAGSVFGGKLQGRELVPMPEVAVNPVAVDEKTGSEGQKTRTPVWVKPVFAGNTPMHKAFASAKTMLEGWIQTHPESFPPVVINVTDGEPDSDPSGLANELRKLATKDGETLLINCHISSKAGQTLVYPTSEGKVPDKYAEQLRSMSSMLPDEILERARANGVDDAPASGSRAFAFNAGIDSIGRIFNFIVKSMRPSQAAGRE
jgi:hypothetical protein